ncbi:extracellular solute-binding protein [Cohnella soli]|uniref:Extracellular solute-binding protein n=1 Tax=Cohnella soli TaxID=425005 RepID=A0ABW0HN54_9BACL
MKRVSFIVSIMMAFVLVVSGCSSKSKNNEGQSSPASSGASSPAASDTGEQMVGNMYTTGLPIAQNKEEITIMIQGGGFDPNEWAAYKKLEEETNIHINWEIIPWGQFDEKKNLMFASGDYPDVIAGWGLTNTEVMKYGPKGVFLPIEDSIDKYAPNIRKMFDEVQGSRDILTTPDGHIYTLPLAWKQPNTGVVTHINQKWLDKLHLQMPTTTDELYQVLKAFKEQDPNGNGKKDEIPLGFLSYTTPAESNQSELGMFGYFGRVDTKEHLVLENGKVVYTAMHDEWLNAVKFLRKLYKEGLIDPEVFTHNLQQYQAKGEQEPPVYGVVASWDGWGGVGEKNFPQYVPFLPVKGPGVENPAWLSGDPSIFPTQFVITSAGKAKKDLIIRWMDHIWFNASEKGPGELYFGPEGKGWEKTADGKWKVLYPEKADWGPISGFPIYYPFNLEDNYYLDPQKNQYHKNVTLQKLYAPYVSEELTNFRWHLWLTPEQQEQASTLQTDIKKATDDFYAKCVIGEGDIDSGYEKFKQELTRMGVDKLVDIYQAAVDASKWAHK